MPIPDRTTIVKGAGAVKLGSLQLYSKGEINAALDPVTFAIAVAGYGNIDERMADSIGRITFTPSGRLTAAIVAAMFPYGNPVIDAGIFGAADVASEVHSLLGQKFVFHNTAVSRMPSLKLSARETAFSGPVEITALNKINTARTDAAAIVTGPTAGAFAPNIDRADIKTVPYTATWGAAGIETQDGWDVDFDVELYPDYLPDYGTINMRIASVTARARCRPVSHSENILALLHTQGAGRAIGTSLRKGDLLTISAPGGLTVILQDAILKQGPLAWGEGTLRAGELGFEATRAFSGGVPGALFSVAMTA